MTLQTPITASTHEPPSRASHHFPARDGEVLTVESKRLDETTTALYAVGHADVVARAELRVAEGDSRGTLEISRPDCRHPDDVHLVGALVEAGFQRYPAVTSLVLKNLKGAPAVIALVAGTVAQEGNGENDALVQRSHFYQLPLLWRRQAAHVSYPLIRSALGPQDRLPPLRPPQPTGEFYRRWLPHLDTKLSLRVIDRRRDLPLFHGWMNQQRVAFFWELAQSEAELDRYLAEQEADPHIFGVIGSFNDEPVSYFEFYWAKEDRLGPHYDTEDFDRGWHGLIGNARHLGRPRTLAWFRSVTHCLFLDEPRTRRIMGEPRASHHKMLSYCADVAYDKVKEFDFPHKRAALVCCERERFFREVVL